MKNNLLAIIIALTVCCSCKKKPGSGPGNGSGNPPEIIPPVEVIISVTKDVSKTIDLPEESTGYNTKYPTESEPWSRLGGKYTIGFKESKASIMRYPGGTVANYWDFDLDLLFRTKANTVVKSKGWINGDFAYVREEIASTAITTNTQQINTIKDLRNVTDATNCTPMFVMNMTTPGWDFYSSENPTWTTPVAGDLSSNSSWKKMLDDRYLRFKRMLTRAQNEGIPIKLIELGNELYFFSDYYEQAFPNGAHYATAANYIAGKFKADYPSLPDLKLSAVASVESTKATNKRVTIWNSQVMPNLDKSKIGYVSMHSYYGQTEPENLTQAGFHSSILSWIDYSNEFNILNDTQAKVYDQNWKVWYTEVYANEDAPRTWANVLINIYTGFYYYQFGNAYIYLQSRFDEQVTPAKTLKPRADGFVPYMEAAQGSVRCNRLNFDGGGNIGSSQQKALQGYVFEKADGVRKAVIVNFSSTAQKVNLQASNLFPAGNVKLSGKVNQLNDADNPDDIPVSTFPTNNITIQPYSVNYVRL